jgi:prepilin-type N-terminal cleavage/methylation domain-containing protein
MMSFLKNDKGFSLAEVMIAVAISGVVALGASKLMSDNYKNQAYIETMAEINKTMAIAQTLFSKKDNCSTFFQMNNITRSAVLPQTVGYVAVNNVRILETGANYGKFSVLSIVVKNSAVNSRIKEIEFTFDWKNRPFMSTAPLKKTISVFAELQTLSDAVPRATDVWKCGGVVEDSKLESQQALCASLGADFATWGVPVPGKCNIKTFQCPAGQVPFTVTSLGHVICKATEDTFDPYSLIDSTPVNCPASAPKIRLVFDGSKYRLECSY